MKKILKEIDIAEIYVSTSRNAIEVIHCEIMLI